MTLKIISAEAIVFEGSVSAVTLPGQLGSFTVLQNHASLISTLLKGKISYVLEGQTEAHKKELEIDGGIVDVDNNIVSVCIF